MSSRRQHGVSVAAVTRYLDGYLRVRSIPDVAGITNGLQHANAGRIDCLVAAVDACQATITAAASAGRALLLVHHGLPDGRNDMSRARMHALRRSEVALFACHIPLDLHPVVGNNTLLAGMLGLDQRRPFGRYGRRKIGVEGRCTLTVRGLVARLEQLLGVAVYTAGGGGRQAGRVAVITGNGTRWIEEAAGAGVDTLVTGEAGHHDALHAEEVGVNLLCAGHYATETLGVKALAAHVSTLFGLPWAFIDHPTDL